MASWIETHASVADFKRPSDALVRRCVQFPTATLYEASGQEGALPAAIKPVANGATLCGPAFTIQSPPQDNLWFHRALALARPGDILVAEVGGLFEAGYWGDVMTNAAVARNLGGVVIDGCVRDGQAIVVAGFPVFSRGLCIRGTAKEPAARGALGLPIRVGDIVIRSGDIVVGDGDGVVVLDTDKIETTLAAAKERDQKEAEYMDALKAGNTTLDLLGLD